MSEWKEYKLGGLAEITSSKRIFYSDYVPVGIRFYRSKEIIEKSLGETSGEPLFISVERFEEIRSKFGAPVDGDLLISAVGERAGIPYVVKNLGDFYFKDGNLIWFRNIKKEFDVVFFCYWLKSAVGKMTLESIMIGSAQKALTIVGLKNLAIKLPPLPEQAAIASILSSLDDKIDLLHRQNTTLEKMAETLFRQWFVEEAKEEWESQYRIEDLVESVSITHKFPKQNIVFLNTSDIYLGNVINHNPITKHSLPGQAKKSIKKDDILFSEIRPANGRWAYVDFDAENYVVSTKLMVLRSKNIISQAFIYFYLTNPATVEWLQMIAESRSGTFPQITFDQIKVLKVNIPSEKILNESIVWCETTLKKIKSNQTQIRTLTAMRDTLLPKLMSGEVKVED